MSVNLILTSAFSGTIGFEFPPAMRQCMIRLSNMEPAAISSHYGLPSVLLSEAIKNRSRGARVYV